ncbi:MAG: TlyA family RNA methyltransferase [Clostridiales bacterium]|jgi:23S rRNA (cytidine1920-2'-O)/16S rRNA (cytidine1409-2'-O)-methyltransferase|nr:TlyA family RNA methyltransferase [Clostridiales bacterium]
MDKERADIVLARSLGVSRSKAKELITSGAARFEGAGVKPSTLVSMDGDIRCEPPKYVGRGGFKLEKALDVFRLSVENAVCLDVGASTGGFTQRLISRGAKKVYAVDAGEGQLDKSLADDGRVVSMEKTNITSLTPEDFDEAPAFACVDVSFVSVTKIMRHVFDLIARDANAVFLVKPQFEAGRENVGKRGVVKNPKTHEGVLRTVSDFARFHEIVAQDVTFSPIRGKSGNIEYLLLLKRSGEIVMKNYKYVVKEAFGALY